MDEATLLKEYTPYLRHIARTYLYDRMHSRISYEDLMQEGYLKLLILCRTQEMDNPFFVRRALRNHMVDYAMRNLSAAKLTNYGRRVYNETRAGEMTDSTRESAQTAMREVVPLESLIGSPSEGESLGMYSMDEDGGLLLSEFTDSLSARQMTILGGLWDGLSQRGVSRAYQIPLITVRRDCQKMKEVLLLLLGEPAPA